MTHTTPPTVLTLHATAELELRLATQALADLRAQLAAAKDLTFAITQNADQIVRTEALIRVLTTVVAQPTVERQRGALTGGIAALLNTRTRSTDPWNNAADDSLHEVGADMLRGWRDHIDGAALADALH